MTTQYTPYETQPPLPDPEPRRSSATKPLMILLAVIGGITLVVILTTSAMSSLVGLSGGSATRTANTTNVTDLDVRAVGASFDVVFADVDEATLETSGSRADAWELTSQSSTLVVDAPSRWWDWGPFWTGNGETRAVLTLPTELNDGTLNAELDLDAGQLTATGDFNQLALEVDAGDATVDGSARALDAQVNAGSADLTLVDVETSNFEVAAGDITTELTGTPPTMTEIDVAAGRLTLTVPAGEYAVTSDIAAGNLNNNLDAATNAPHEILVEIAAGEVVLNPGAASDGF